MKPRRLLKKRMLPITFSDVHHWIRFAPFCDRHTTQLYAICPGATLQASTGSQRYKRHEIAPPESGICSICLLLCSMCVELKEMPSCAYVHRFGVCIHIARQDIYFPVTSMVSLAVRRRRLTKAINAGAFLPGAVYTRTAFCSLSRCRVDYRRYKASHHHIILA